MNGEQIRYGEMHSTTVTSYGFSRKIKYRPLSNSTKYVSTDSTFLEGIARRNPEFFKPTNGYVPEAFAFRMRCMKKLHRIIVFPNGEVTLTSHLGEVASKRDEMYRWSHGEECACRQFKNQWVKALDNRWYHGDDVKSMPAKARKLLKIISVWAKHRRSFDPHRYSPKTCTDGDQMIFGQWRRGLRVRLIIGVDHLLVSIVNETGVAH